MTCKSLAKEPVRHDFGRRFAQILTGRSQPLIAGVNSRITRNKVFSDDRTYFADKW